MDSEIVDLINKILEEKFELPKEKLVPESHLKFDLNLDSLDFVDMVVLIEDKYNLGVRGTDFMNIQTLGDVYKIISDLKTSEESKKTENASVPH